MKTKKKTVTKEEFENDTLGNMVSKTTTTIEDYEEVYEDGQLYDIKDDKTKD